MVMDRSGGGQAATVLVTEPAPGDEDAADDVEGDARRPAGLPGDRPPGASITTDWRARLGGQ
jgi:hypothetical protein